MSTRRESTYKVQKLHQRSTYKVQKLHQRSTYKVQKLHQRCIPELFRIRSVCVLLLFGCCCCCCFFTRRLFYRSELLHEDRFTQRILWHQASKGGTFLRTKLLHKHLYRTNCLNVLQTKVRCCILVVRALCDPSLSLFPNPRPVPYSLY